MEFPVVRAESGFSMAAPMFWRFTPANVEQVGGDSGVTALPEFASPWQSDEADHFGEILRKALLSGNADELLDHLCPESRTSKSIVALRHNIALNAAILDGLPVKIRSRFPLHASAFLASSHRRWLRHPAPSPRSCPYSPSVPPSIRHRNRHYMSFRESGRQRIVLSRSLGLEAQNASTFRSRTPIFIRSGLCLTS